MLSIEKVNFNSPSKIKRFIRLPHRLYRQNPYWVPLLDLDARMYFNRKDFPYYDHSDADFFIAVRAGQDVGRIAVLEHRLFNTHHSVRHAQFYFFDCENDPEAAVALFDQAARWARARGLTTLVGPKGFGALDGYGILIQGFDQRQMMSSTHYNHAYYRALVEAAGFVKEEDFISARLEAASFQMPNWLRRLAEQAPAKTNLRVETYATVNSVAAAGQRIFETYNRSFIANWEHYPVPLREIEFTVNNLKPVVNPRLFKVIFHQTDMVGFLFGVPDLSAALQRSQGRLNPLSLLDLLWEKRQTRAVVLVAMGVLEPYRLSGGGALLIAEIEKTMHELGLQQVGLVNNADSAARMRSDLEALGVKPSIIHRVYRKHLG